MTREDVGEGHLGEGAGGPSDPISLRPVEERQWNDTLGIMPDAAPFLGTPWIEALARHARTESLRLGVFYGSELVALCPILVLRRTVIKALVSPPVGSWIPYLGPAWKDSAVERERMRLDLFEGLVGGLERLARSARASLVFLRLSPQMGDVRSFLWRGFSCRPRYALRGDVAEGRGAALPPIPGRRERAMIVAETGSLDDLRPLLRRVAAPSSGEGPRSVAFLEEMLRKLPTDDAEVLIARRGSNPVDGAVVLYGATAAVCWIGPFGRRPEDAEAVAAVLELAIRKARARGRRWFEVADASGLDAGEVVSRFPLQPVPYYEVFKARGIGRLAASRYGRRGP